MNRGVWTSAVIKIKAQGLFVATCLFQHILAFSAAFSVNYLGPMKPGNEITEVRSRYL